MSDSGLRFQAKVLKHVCSLLSRKRYLADQRTASPQWGDTTPGKVTPVILHGVVSPGVSPDPGGGSALLGFQLTPVQIEGIQKRQMAPNLMADKTYPLDHNIDVSFNKVAISIV